MSDGIMFASAFDDEALVSIVFARDCVEAARRAHDCWPTSAAALGRTLCVTALLAGELKNADEKIITVINGHGPAGTILVQAKGSGALRGFIGDPHIYLVKEDGHLDVGKAVGTSGTLTVTKDLCLRHPFSGVTELQTGEIGDDFAFYFATSEQTPAVVAAGVLVNPDMSVKAAGALLVKLLPGASEQTIAACEKTAADLEPMTAMMAKGMTREDIINKYFTGVNQLGEKPVFWQCGCSKEKFAGALMTLPGKDLDEMISDGRPAEITCQYCQKRYTFDTDELRKIRAEKDAENRLS